MIADVEGIKGNSKAVDNFGAARKSSHGKIERRHYQMRNHHEDQEMFDVRNYFYGLCRHARFMECLQRKPRQHKGGLTAQQHKEVAEKLAQEVFGTADGLGKNERIDAGAEISDYRVRHEQ